MSKKYNNTFRIPSARASWWDYSKDGTYFITICTKNKVHYFGNRVNDEMVLNDLGKQAFKYWEEITKYHPYVLIDAFIIMPNHIHGIIIIDKPYQNLETQTNNQFGPQSQNLSSIIRGYKSAVTKYAKCNSIVFQWQPRFYDHIIKNAFSYQNIVNYIYMNPMDWYKDNFNIGNK